MMEDDQDDGVVAVLEPNDHRRNADYALVALIERITKLAGRLGSLDDRMERLEQSRLEDREHMAKVEKAMTETLQTLTDSVAKLQSRMEEVPSERHRVEHDFVKSLIEKQRKEAEFWEGLLSDFKSEAVRWVGKAVIWTCAIGVIVSLGKDPKALSNVLDVLQKVLGVG